MPPSPITIARRLADGVRPLTFAAPVTHVYRTLDYAWPAVEAYLERYAGRGATTVLLGMNPGPFGMVQTGVPFGEIEHVRDFLGIEAPIGRPDDEHPKRRVEGFDCPRSEVSGRRLWGWARERFGTADAFFARFFVWNYCPLAFLEESGRNRTPDKLPAREREALAAPCDAALRDLVAALDVDLVIGVGAYARRRAETILAEAVAAERVRVGGILHPSPASPAANRGWAEQAERQLDALGVGSKRRAVSRST